MVNLTFSAQTASLSELRAYVAEHDIVVSGDKRRKAAYVVAIEAQLELDTVMDKQAAYECEYELDELEQECFDGVESPRTSHGCRKTRHPVFSEDRDVAPFNSRFNEGSSLVFLALPLVYLLLSGILALASVVVAITSFIVPLIHRVLTRLLSGLVDWVEYIFGRDRYRDSYLQVVALFDEAN